MCCMMCVKGTNIWFTVIFHEKFLLQLQLYCCSSGNGIVINEWPAQQIIFVIDRWETTPCITWSRLEFWRSQATRQKLLKPYRWPWPCQGSKRQVSVVSIGKNIYDIRIQIYDVEIQILDSLNLKLLIACMLFNFYDVKIHAIMP